MDKTEMSLTDYMKMYRDEKHKMVSISQSINAKERKIKVLKEEYHSLAVETQKLGWKKITISFEELLQVLKKHLKSKDVNVSIVWPTVDAPKNGDLTKNLILYRLNQKWIDVIASTRCKKEKFYLPFKMNDTLRNGEKVEDCIKIKRVEISGESKYQISVDENLLNFTYNIDDCVVFERGTLMFAKNLQGSILKYLMEKEQANENENVGEIE